ncbi:MAG: hypothetical protein NC419_13425, partial [Muribaculaceae bacterium]|nr:hypothetical protein [Muribaculaceae bacterium]
QNMKFDYKTGKSVCNRGKNPLLKPKLAKYTEKNAFYTELLVFLFFFDILYEEDQRAENRHAKRTVFDEGR